MILTLCTSLSGLVVWYLSSACTSPGFGACLPEFPFDAAVHHQPVTDRWSKILCVVLVMLTCGITGWACSAKVAAGRECGYVFLLMLTLTVGASFDLAERLVPDSVWIAAIVGWLIYTLSGKQALPDYRSVLCAALTCYLLNQMMSKSTRAFIGGADIAALMTSSFLLSPSQLSVLIASSSALALASSLGRVRHIPYIPYCYCALAIASTF